MEIEHSSPFKYFTLAPLGGDSLQHGEASVEPLDRRTTRKDSVLRLDEGVEELKTVAAQSELKLPESAEKQVLEEHVPTLSRFAGFDSTPRVIRTAVETVDDVDVFISLDGDKSENLEYLALVTGDDVKTPSTRELARTVSRRVYVGEALNKEASMPPPWAGNLGPGNWIRSPLLQLHKEIVDFCDFVSPTEEEHQERIDAVERISVAVKSIWPNCQVHVFGSFATGLYLPTSDIDIVILSSGCQVLKDGLRALAKTLSKQSLAKKIQVIAHARVPIIKFVEKQSNISFDISFDVANGPQAAQFIKAATELLPPLRPLCLVLKIFLQQRDLNEVYSGGIGSYALLVMLLTHLQMHPSRWKKREGTFGALAEDNLGMLLVDFFDLYGRSLNLRDVGVSCRDGGRFYSKRLRGFSDLKRPHLLSVEDPQQSVPVGATLTECCDQTPENDIGKNSFSILKVQSAFALAYQLLTKFHVDEAPVDVGLLGRIVRMDRKLIERKVPVPNYLNGQSSAIRVPNYLDGQSPAGQVPPYSPGTGQFLSDDDSDDFQQRHARKRGRWHDEEDKRDKSEQLSSRSARKKKRRAAVEQSIGRKISKREWKGLVTHGSSPQVTDRVSNEVDVEGSKLTVDRPSSSSRKQCRRGRFYFDNRDDGHEEWGKSPRKRAVSSSPNERRYSVDEKGLHRRGPHKQSRGYDGTGHDGRSSHDSPNDRRSRRHQKHEENVAGTSNLERDSQRSRFARIQGSPQARHEGTGSSVEQDNRKLVTTTPAHKKIKF